VIACCSSLARHTELALSVFLTVRIGSLLSILASTASNAAATDAVCNVHSNSGCGATSGGAATACATARPPKATQRAVPVVFVCTVE
jgi:hypothetical protein